MIKRFCIKRWQIVLLSLVAVLGITYLLLKLLPNSSLNAFMQRQNSTRFYDRNGQLLHILALDDGLRREWYDLESIPENVQKAFIEAEDKNFYFHPGVDVTAIFRAASQNKEAGRIVSGASTITMQLVRIIYPRKKASVTLGVKIKEVFLALYLEIKLSKKQILELYLNSVPFGKQIEGVGSASRSFFGIKPEDLTQEQIEVLAKIPRRPADYAPEKNYDYPSRCPHFIQYVISEYAKTQTVIPNDLTLSINAQWNELTERLIQLKLTEFQDARIHNGAAFVVDNASGEVLIWCGNASFDDKEHNGEIDGVLVANQPGSSMKPFLYARALERGFDPSSVLPDIPLDFGGAQVYVPLNFNNRYNGPVRMRVALASSLNIPAVYVLYRIGVDDYMECLDSLGFDSLKGTRESTGLSIALGSSEVTLFEMVRAFSVFARDGKVLEHIAVVPSQKQEGKRVYAKDTARILCNMLSDKNARVLGFGNAKVFETTYPCLFKTGTSNQYQNIIAMGSTSSLTVGVWMGNFEGETVVGQTGSSIPASVVRTILDELTKTYSAQEFAQPESYIQQNVCTLSGMKATEDCPSVTREYVALGRSVHFEPCSWHETRNGKTIIKYPSEYQHWAAQKNFSGETQIDGSELSFLYPRNNAHFIFDPTIKPSAQMLPVEVTGGHHTSASLYYDGKNMGTVSDVFSWHIALERGTHTLTAECGTERTSITFTVK